jgi:hypothetical protein
MWQGRFASFVMDEPYLLAAARYVELNPRPRETSGRGIVLTRRARVCAGTFFTAGLAFWLPSVVLHAMRGPRFGVFDMLVLSVASPGTACVVFVALCAVGWGCSLAWRVSMFLLGIWMLGPPSMTFGATFSGGGLSVPSSLGELVFLLACFAVSTPMMATYDGSLFALFIVTCVFAVLLIAAVADRKS